MGTPTKNPGRRRHRAGQGRAAVFLGLFDTPDGAVVTHAVHLEEIGFFLVIDGPANALRVMLPDTPAGLRDDPTATRVHVVPPQQCATLRRIRRFYAAQSLDWFVRLLTTPDPEA